MKLCLFQFVEIINMIGQKNLLNKLNNYTLDTFPHSTLILGEEGSGKHLICSYIKDLLKLPLLDITENISDEYINTIYRNPNPTIYMVDLEKMTEKEQNILLKFIEEPLKTAFIILLCENRNALLDTVYNRCVIFEMDLYTKDELSNFVSSSEDKELILAVLRTPGKILNTNLSNIRAIYDICDKMVDKLNIANFSNTLTIKDKINYKDEYNKFDINVFFDMLIYNLYNKYLTENNIKFYKMYLLTMEYRKRLIDKRINKEIFVENFLTKLWKESRL